MSSSREILEKQIAQLEAQLKVLKIAYRDTVKLEAVSGLPESPSTKFVNVRPIEAIRQLLEERKKPIPMRELVQHLLDGGIAIGKKRAIYNVQVSIRISVKTGNLTMTKDEMVGLPEWKKA